MIKILKLPQMILFILTLVTLQAQSLAMDKKLFSAIRQVETSNKTNPPDGDDGASIGPYQIKKEYWKDAVTRDGKIISDIKYSDCRNKEKAEKVMMLYWQRYAKDALDNKNYEKLARIHNGGPSGHKKKSTEKYWKKIKDNL